MITYVTGNLLDSTMHALVNPVNCVGVAGKGLALAFKEKYPRNFEAYKLACQFKGIAIGTCYTYIMPNRIIINFPTKTNWRYPSRLKYIIEGLHDLRSVITQYKIRGIAIPALGCGNGSLNWEDVKAILEGELGHVTIPIEIYLPQPTLDQ